jgi:hypothetical protein
MKKPDEYEQQLDKRLRKYMRVSDVNRWLYQRIGNWGYRAVFDHYKNKDAREWMRRAYQPRWWTLLAHYLFVQRNKKPFLPIYDDCTCVVIQDTPRNVFQATQRELCTG